MEKSYQKRLSATEHFVGVRKGNKVRVLIGHPVTGETIQRYEWTKRSNGEWQYTGPLFKKAISEEVLGYVRDLKS